jgi:Flp pilus assembly protein TadD
MSLHATRKHDWLLRAQMPLGRIFGVCLLVTTLAALALRAAPAQTSYASSVPTLLPAPNSTRTPDESLNVVEQEIRNMDYAAAITALKPLVQAHPDSWRAHYDLGYALFRVREGTASLQENLRESIRELARSLQLNAGNSDAHKTLGLDLTMIQREDLAGVEFAEAVRLSPSSPEDHYFLGRHFMHQSQYSNAVPELTKATQLDPTYAKAFENLGITLDRLGSVDDALKCLNHAVELDEKNFLHSERPYLDLAHFYQVHGNTTAALPLALEAVNLNPRSEEALLQLALLYRANRNWQQALQALQKAEKLHPGAAETQYLLGRTYKALGDTHRSQQAFANFDRFRKLTEPDPSSLTAAGPE